MTHLIPRCLDAFGEMPSMVAGRPILKKQTNYGFYRPGAISLANLFADIPFSATRILIFNIIVYFMTNFHRSAGGFFTFHIFNWIAFLAMQGFFRTFGLLCKNFDSAFRLSVFFIPNMCVIYLSVWVERTNDARIQYSGYMLPVGSMKRWLFWIVRFFLWFQLAYRRLMSS